MKLYTNIDQTAKLVELGFKKPNGLEFLVREQDNPDNAQIVQRIAYSIGELIEMLPAEITVDHFTHDRVISKNEVLYYSWMHEVYFHIFDKNDELIDNLFKACVKLKEEGIL